MSELSYAHAKAGREHAEQVLAGAAEMPEALFSLPANRRVVNDALGIITHNRWTADLIAAEMLNTPVQVLSLIHISSFALSASTRSAGSASSGRFKGSGTISCGTGKEKRKMCIRDSLERYSGTRRARTGRGRFGKRHRSSAFSALIFHERRFTSCTKANDRIYALERYHGDLLERSRPLWQR